MASQHYLRDSLKNIQISLATAFLVVILNNFLIDSDTTRNPRPGEANDLDYHFVTRSEFEALREQSLFLEWAEFSKNLYGTSISAVKQVLDSGKMCILDIDLQGVHSVKKCAQDMQPLFIFIMPPSFEELKCRLVNRNTESPESISLRLATAQDEIRFAKENPNFHDAIIINDDLERAYNQLKEVVFQKSN